MYYKINNIYVQSNYLNKNFCLINADIIQNQHFTPFAMLFICKSRI